MARSGLAAFAVTCGLAFATTCALPLSAQTDPALYPAAQCAAFWFGWDDHARRSALLDRTPGDLERAGAFRLVAHRLSSGPAAGIDAFIADQRGLMMQMIEEGIFGADDSRGLMERLMQTCADFAETQPETAGLP